MLRSRARRYRTCDRDRGRLCHDLTGRSRRRRRRLRSRARRFITCDRDRGRLCHAKTGRSRRRRRRLRSGARRCPDWHGVSLELRKQLESRCAPSPSHSQFPTGARLTGALAQGLGRPSTAWRRQRWSTAVGLSLAPAQRKLHAARPWCNLYLCPPDAVRRSAAQAAPRNGALCPKGHRLQHATSIDSSSTSWCPRVDATPRAVGDVPR